VNKESKLLAEAYDLVNSKKRLLSGIKPEFQKLYIKDLEYFNGSYKDHADFLNKAQEMGHLNEDENSMPSTHGTPGYEGKEITLNQLNDYNSGNDVEDVFDMLYKGVKSGQISYDTFTAFMKSFIN